MDKVVATTEAEGAHLRAEVPSASLSDTADWRDVLIDDLRDALENIIDWYAVTLRDAGASTSDVQSDGAIARSRALLARAKERIGY